MVASCIRKQDPKANRISDDKLIVNHRLRGIQQDLLFSEVKLEVLVNHDLVTVGQKFDNARIAIVIESLKLRELESIDRFFIERIRIGRIMKSGGNDVLKNLTLVDTIT